MKRETARERANPLAITMRSSTTELKLQREVRRFLRSGFKNKVVESYNTDKDVDVYFIWKNNLDAIGMGEISNALRQMCVMKDEHETPNKLNKKRGGSLAQ